MKLLIILIVVLLPKQSKQGTLKRPPPCFSEQQATRMDGVKDVKEFLESSTIHGLSYIAANRRLVRLFWICDQQATRMFGVKDVKELPLIGAVC